MFPLKLLLVALCVVSFGNASLPPIHAAELEMKIVNKDCWIEIFDDDDFDQDDPHIKIYGPKEIATFKNFQGKDWNDDIESVIVGSDATVLAYADKDFQGTEIAFTQNQRVPDLGKLDMKNEIESMKIECGRK
jgi:hypothetical protein